MAETPLSVLLQNIRGINVTNEGNKKRKELLEVLRTLLSTFNADGVVDLENESLEVLFECLGSDDEDEVDTVSGILKHLMVIMNPKHCLHKYHEYILQGFQHPNPIVRTLVISQLEHCVVTGGDSITRHLCTEYQFLVISAMNQISSSDLRTAKAVDAFLVHLCQCPSGTEFVLGHPGISTFKTLLDSTNETIKFRVYETLVNIANISKDHLEKLEQERMVVVPLSEIVTSSNDPLGQLNALEILATLAESKHGSEHLEKTELMNRIHRICPNWKEGTGHLLIPGIIKFIGRIGTVQLPAEELVDTIFEVLLDSGKDYSLGTVATEALCFIGSTDRGKQFLQEKQNFGKCLERIRYLSEVAPVEFRSRIIDALRVLFSSVEEGTEAPQFLSQWFKSIFPDLATLQLLLQHIFPEIRLGNLRLFASLAGFEWAQAIYLRIPGLVELLVQRNSELNEECEIAKFEIVKSLATSSTVAKFLTNEDISRFKIHIDQGLHYSATKPIISMEGA